MKIIQTKVEMELMEQFGILGIVIQFKLDWMKINLETRLEIFSLSSDPELYYTCTPHYS